MNLDDLKNLASGEKLSGLGEKISDIKEKVGDVAHTAAEKAEEIGKKVNIDAVRNLADNISHGARKVEQAVDNFPGAAIDKADKDKVTPDLVKERTNKQEIPAITRMHKTAYVVRKSRRCVEFRNFGTSLAFSPEWLKCCHNVFTSGYNE